MKVIGDLFVSGLGINGLRMHLHLDVIILGVDDLRREEEKRANDDRLSERDVVHDRYARRRFAVQARVCPC